MKKHSKIFFLFILLIFLTTYIPKDFKPFFFSKNNNWFKVESIEITNNNFVSDEEILSQLDEIYGKNIFFVKITDFEDKLFKITFIEKIKVKKKYPKTIKIKIHEEKPIAILNKKGSKFLICESSKLISFREDLASKNLPNVFGEGSEKELTNFLKVLKENKFPINNIKKFYFFKVGRWDMELANNQIIRLPFTRVEKSIKQLITLLNRKDFEKFKVIDLRISDKIITE